MAYEIELISLYCRDAKEAPEDEVVLVVNGLTIWGPTKMGTGDNRSVDRRVSFDDQITIELWEEDPGRGRRNDIRFGLLTVTGSDVRGYLREPPIGMPCHDFQWVKTRLTDAKYQLTYNLHQV